MSELLKTTKGPHKAILEALESIVFFLDAETWKEARLVCREFNSRMLDNLTKKMRLQRFLVKKRCQENFPLLDGRMLKIPRVEIRPFQFSETAKLLKDTLSYFRSVGKLERLQSLNIPLNAETFPILVAVVNEGGLQGLRDFFLSHLFFQNKEGLTFKPLTLPSLKSLFIFPNRIDTEEGDGEEVDYRLPKNMLSFLQSIVKAAPKLEKVHTLTFLDLTGTKVKTLLLANQGHQELSFAEGNAMISAVRESVSHLSLVSITPEFGRAPFPNLKRMECTWWFDFTPKLKLNALTELRKLVIQFPAIIWESIVKILPPFGRLQELKLMDCPLGLPATAGAYNILLNAKLKSLRLVYDRTVRMNIINLLELLSLVELVDEDRAGESGLLTFDMERLEEEDVEFEGNLSLVLEKLGRKWGLVRLNDCWVKKMPIWTEKKVPLFGGDRKGRIRITATIKANNFVVVSLELCA